MSLPAFVPVPPAKLKRQIDPSEWEAFLAAWNSLAKAYIALPEEDFTKQALRPDAGTEVFLESFISYAVASDVSTGPSDLEKSLKQSSFALISRISSLKTRKSSRLQSISFIQDFCSVYLQSPQLKKVAEELWEASSSSHGIKLAEWKNSWIKDLNSVSQSTSQSVAKRLTPFVACVKLVPNCGSFLMEGSDFLDSIISAWERIESGTKRKLAIITFYCLTSLIEGEQKNTTLLLDHLYSLKADYDNRDKGNKSPSLLEELLGTTPLMLKLSNEFSKTQGRGQTLLHEFTKINKQSGLQQPRIRTQRLNKGKGKDTTHDDDDMHIHKMSLVTQVQDLFPELGVSRILELLDAYDDNPERVIGYLLDNPPSPAAVEESNTTAPPLPTVSEALSKLPPHAPYVSQVPRRKNIYDDEDLAELALDPSRLYTGRKPDSTALQTPSNTTKAAILSALAAFDSDSDERDDTYDVDDVGGTVDTTVSGTGDEDTGINEETLYMTWKSTPAIFTRDAATRRSKARADLREKTGLTDESIEGWGIMLSRDTRRQERLEKRYSSFAGQQTELQSLSWKAGDETGDSEGDVQRHHTDRGRGGRNRGRGGGRGRGKAPDSGNADAGSSQQNTANDRRRKDANKASRANHNRRDQRAKKISRAGFPG